ncbi:MAG: helix-turn-helix domain-containing protein [Sphaerochaetaceae bacterium]|nr:helix-turn-helix domain-containing protein [Sphaerochaetaceae bacterium]
MKLAEEASLSPGMIGDIETYKKTPSLETIEKIANAFNVPVSRLLLNPDEDENDVRLRTNKEKIDNAIEILRSLE